MSEALQIRVNAADGCVTIGAVELAARMPLAQVRQAAVVLLRGERDVGNGHVWLSLGGLRLADRPADLGLCFFQGELMMITFAVTLPEDRQEAGWPTEESSWRQVQFMRRALAQQLGGSLAKRAREFRWGRVWCDFDPRGFVASAGLAYTGQH